MPGPRARLRSLAGRALGAAPDLLERLAVAERLVEREVMTGPSVSLPPARRLALWRHGFTSRSGALFGIDGAYDRYLSDYRLERLGGLGGRWADVADNKLVAHFLLEAFDDHLPTVYGLLDGGRLYRELPDGGEGATDPAVVAAPALPRGPDGRARAGPWARAYLDAHGALVLKPVYGNSGRGVLVCRRRGDGGGGADAAGDGTPHDTTGAYVVNGEPYSADGFDALVGALEDYLAWSFVEQADYAAALFPDATNTLRVVTLWDEAADEPFVSGAVQRIGTVASAPVDNWSQGGLSAEVGEDGTLSSAARWDDAASELGWHDRHPDTGERIAGRRVPDWPAVREGVLAMAEELSSLPRVGWDVVVTDDGFELLELNTHAGVETLQVHRPVLADPRTRRFFERRDDA
jgi:hypothetical protein